MRIVYISGGTNGILPVTIDLHLTLPALQLALQIPAIWSAIVLFSTSSVYLLSMTPFKAHILVCFYKFYFQLTLAVSVVCVRVELALNQDR